MKKLDRRPRGEERGTEDFGKKPENRKSIHYAGYANQTPGNNNGEGFID
ncbi:hypothetical protein NXW62_06480 [Bacteroides fragilis]|nr:hypothetical protein [Bacteroides fragilis]